MAKLIALILSLIASAIVGSEGSIERKLESALKEELAGRVKDVHVEVHSNPGSFLLKGKIASMDFTFDEFYVKPVLMDDVYFNVKNIRINLLSSAISREAKVESVGEILFRLTIREDDLAKGLAEKAKNILEPTVEINNGKIILSGKYRLGFLKVPFSVAGYGTFENKTTLNFRIDEVRFVGLRMPESIDRLLEREVNPIFDLDKFYEEKGKEWKLNEEMLGRELNLTVRQIRATEGKIIITGSV